MVKHDMARAEARFWGWEPPGDGRQFRCCKSPSRMVMTDEMCRARARKPEVFRERCGGRRACPRWRHYRRLARRLAKLFGGGQDDAKRTPYR